MMTYLILACLCLIIYASYFVARRILKTQEAIEKIQSKQRQQQNTVQNFGIDPNEVSLFDEAAQCLMQKTEQVTSFNQAALLQTEVLNKLPAKTSSQIRQLDLNEWSVYWSFEQQSLEYYVSQYGVFIAHVDRDGNEHRKDLVKTSSVF